MNFIPHQDMIPHLDMFFTMKSINKFVRSLTIQQNFWSDKQQKILNPYRQRNDNDYNCLHFMEQISLLCQINTPQSHKRIPQLVSAGII